MIRFGTFISVLYSTCLFGFSHSNRVTQTPLHLIRNPAESAVIECSHTVSGYDRVGWYKQTTDSQSFTLIGYVYAKATPNKEAEFQDKVDISGDGNNDVTLSIKDLSASDSAVYFCAAYYTVLQSCSTAIQKHRPR
ncbi:hypothetical protein AMEX_G17869 [Astyanax mexicanus]|uniref:Ig-like domain-containing protein n=1 Tax=Astyanax mexicanus TaxID=7994 RepID=A0A8T2LAV8_ASTMX|nr:hypothetical protein AMEX_G17869 [Astyanax mexicanus]